MTIGIMIRHLAELGWYVQEIRRVHDVTRDRYVWRCQLGSLGHNHTTAATRPDLLEAVRAAYIMATHDGEAPCVA